VFAGGNAGDFKADIGLCGTMAADATCPITITFTPSAAGSRSTNLVVADNQAGSPQAFLVNAIGAGAAYATPASLDFGNQILGQSNTQLIKITNTGTVNLSLNSVTVTGDFTASNNCALIVSSGSCQITLSFTPTTTGARTGTLSITDNTFAGNRQISLTGNGSDFQLAGAGNAPVSTTVKSGQPATYSLSLSPSGGFTGAVTLACLGAPQDATCSISPATLQLSSAGSVPFTVTVTTQQVVSAITGPQVFFAGIGFASLALVPLMFLRRFRSSLRVRSIALSILLIVFCLGAPGCGGGGGGTPTPAPTPIPTPVPTPTPVVQNTPAGTYTLTLTATSGGASRQLPLTLIVQ
jgi:hypothetical protein